MQALSKKILIRPALFAMLFPLVLSAISVAQVSALPGQLDPTRKIENPVPVNQGQPQLPEQYIWSQAAGLPAKSGSITSGRDRSAQYFRATFQVSTLPAHATLYIAGLKSAEAYIDGRLAENVQDNPASPLKMNVFLVDVSGLLHPGKNVLALKAAPGSPTSTGETYMVVKIVPLAPNLYGPALLVSGPSWKSAENAAPGWQNLEFDDTSWKPVHAFGPIESSIEFYQGNDDAGLYRWPGYVGVSLLAHFTLPAAKVEQVFRGRGGYSNLGSLTSAAPSDAEKRPDEGKQPDAEQQADAGQQFVVHLPSANVPEEEAPSLLLDFGKEVTGRIEFVSASNHPIRVTVQYGESREEALHEPYLGIDPLTIPPNATAYGPKSAFRFVKIRFIGGGRNLRFRSIALDDIYYPTQYEGSFVSSDPLLNKIWEVGAYTDHLCMQDDIWDAPKRDRRRWAGDLDVSGRVIDDVFGDHYLMQDTMTRLIGPVSVKTHVNGIAGYSAWWISVLDQYYLHTGSTDFLRSLHEPLVQLLNYMDTEIDKQNLYANKTHSWPFVDWSPELNGDHPEALRATQFEFYLGYRDGAFLLRSMGDTANADRFDRRAQQLKDAAQKHLLDPSTNTFGMRWQTNAIAIFSGVASPRQYAPIWKHVLSSVGHTKYTALVMTPYYNYYIISAMAETGHRAQALDWIRQYWGGMLAEGATSFWEAYYPSWPKQDFHASLQADDQTGYFVSLAHGWSTGPTAWVMEQILGIQPTAAGFRKVTIRPDLAGLRWAKGGEPTPHGMLTVALEQTNELKTTIDLPPGVEATVLIPNRHPGHHVTVNGKAALSGTAAENGARTAVVLNHEGHYVLQAE